MEQTRLLDYDGNICFLRVSQSTDGLCGFVAVYNRHLNGHQHTAVTYARTDFCGYR